MYCIRGLKSSMDKISYPSGNVVPLGTISDDPDFEYSPDNSGGYGSNILFIKQENNPNNWSVLATSIISKIDQFTGRTIYKTCSVQGRNSDDGSLFPANSTNKYLSTTYRYWRSSSTYDIQRFKFNRNSVPYSAIDESIVFQVNISINDNLNGSVSVRTPSTFTNGASVGNLLPINLRRRVPENYPTSIESVYSGDVSWSFRDINNNHLTGSSLSDYYISGLNDDGYNGYFADGDVSYNPVELAISSANLAPVIDNVHYIEIYGANILGRVTIDVTAEIRAALKIGCTKHPYVGLRFIVAYSKGKIDGSSPTTISDESAIRRVLMHESDFLADQTIVSSDGEFIIIKFNRYSKVDVLFNNVELGLNLTTDANNEIRVNKKTASFNVGGSLTIIQKHNRRKSGKNRTYTYIVPDTVAPDTPVFTSASRINVYGTGTRGDVVYVSRNDIILGTAIISSTNTFEVVIMNTVLENGDVITIYTQDAAGNKSEDVVVTLENIASENRVNIGLNGDVIEEYR